MPYRLKKEFEAFKVVDGPLAGQEFKHGETYGEVPEGRAHKFERVEAPQPAEAPKRKKGGDS